MIILKKFIGLFSLFLVLVFTAVSQTDSLRLLPDRDILNEDNLKKVNSSSQEIISACLSSKKVEDLPMTIHVVTREDIIRNNYITLVDILKTLPGMRVSQPGSGEMGEMFLMRGLLGNKYTKILINNIPIKPSVTKGMPISAQIPIRQAERVEIIYGPASSIYGADASSGVINIVTKQVKTTSFSQADASVGTHGYSYFNFLVGGKAGRSDKTFDYTVFGNSYTWNNMDIYSEEDDVYKPLSYYNLFYPDGINAGGQTYEPSELTTDLIEQNNLHWIERDIMFDNYKGTYEKPDFARIPEESSMMGFTFKFKKWDISFLHMERQTHSSLGLSSYLFRYDDPSAFTGDRTNRLTVSRDQQFGKLNSKTNLSYVSYRIKNNSTRVLTYKLNTDKVYFYSASDDIFGEQIFTWSKSENLELTFGSSFQYSGNLPITNDMDKPFKPETYQPFSTEIDLRDDAYYDFYTSKFAGAENFGIHPVTFGNVALFGQVFYEWRKFTFLTGLRIDHNTKYKFAFNPRTAVLYKINHKHSLRAAWGEAFKEPSTSTMYYSLAYAGADVDMPNTPIAYEYRPNPDLSPETISTFELGYRRIFQNMDIDVSFYTFDLVNQIVSLTKFDETNGENLGRININNVQDSAFSHMLGLQTSFRFKNLYEPLKLKADFTFDLTAGEEHLPESNDVIYMYRQVPFAMGNLSFTAEPFKNAYVKLSAYLVGPWYRQFGRTEDDFENEYNMIDGYTSVDLVFSYTFGKYLTGFINIKNLTHEDVYGIDVTGTDADLHHNPQPGRNIRFGITFRRN